VVLERVNKVFLEMTSEISIKETASGKGEKSHFRYRKQCMVKSQYLTTIKVRLQECFPD
jgi:hypothetical protein